MPKAQPEKTTAKYSLQYSREILPGPPEPCGLEELEARFDKPRAVSRRQYRAWEGRRLGQLKRLRTMGFSWRHIGRTLGVTHAGARWAYLHHVLGREERKAGGSSAAVTRARKTPAPAKHFTWCPTEDSLLLEGARKYSNRELAELLERTPGGVAGRLHRLRTRKVRPMTKRGPIRLKRALAEAGISMRKAAQLYNRPGLSTSSISDIVNYGKWPKARGLKEHILKVHRQVGLPTDGLFEPISAEEPEEEAQMLTKVYLHPACLKSFGLDRDPFATEPGRRSEVFADGPFAEAAAQVMDAAREQRMLALCADVGAGKSTLYAYAREELERAGVTVIEPAFFEMDRLHAAGIVEVILSAYGQKPRATLVARKRQVEETLRLEAEAGRPVAMVIDEAHRLADKTMASLKIFWELREGYLRFLSIILIGQKGLEWQLRNNAGFKELGERCQIVRLPVLTDPARLADYLKFKLRLAGGKLSDIITHHAIEAIAERAQTPQEANNLAARVLETAWRLGEAKPIRKEVVEQALRSTGGAPEPSRPRFRTVEGGAGKKE